MLSHKVIMAIYGTTDVNIVLLRTCIGFLIGAGAATLQNWLLKRK